MLAGERPFQGERETAVLHGILHEEPKGLRAQREEIPVALEQVSRRCLQKDREERYGSAEALLEDLQVMRSKEHSGTDATWAAPPLRRALSAPRRSAD
jgi:serine/threonine-protein kinase